MGSSLIDLIQKLSSIIMWITIGLVIIQLLLFIAYVVLSFKKSNLSKLYIKEVTISLINALNDRIIRISKVLIPVLFITTILQIIFIEEVFLSIKNLISANSEISLILFGALITIVFSTLRNYISLRRKRKIEKNKESIMIFYDIKQIINELKLIEATHKVDCIDYDSQWKVKYYNISDLMTYEHYESLCNFYEKVKRFNHLAEKKKEDEACIIAKEIIQVYYDDGIIPTIGMTLMDVYDDLNRVSKNKRIKAARLYKLFDYFVFLKFYKRHYNLIERIILDEISKNKTTDGKIIDKKASDRIEEQGLKKGFVKEVHIKRAIFETSLNSNKFKRVWGDYIVRDFNK